MRSSVGRSVERGLACLAVTLAVALNGAVPVNAQSAAAAAETLSVPVLVPITGFLSLEGTSQRNGALLALGMAPPGAAAVVTEVIDTATSPEAAVTAFERALDRPGVIAMVGSMLGTQMLAMLPLADEHKVPVITVSGTAAVTERGSNHVFRFFPADPIAKLAHARYVVETLGARRPALITQTTAYGQSGRNHLMTHLRALGAEPVFDDALDPGVKDMTPVIAKALAANPDVLVLHLHSGPTALFIRQAALMRAAVPIVAGSAMHQPSTAALLEPSELKGVCAETASSPISQDSAGTAEFVAEYRARFGSEPDAFALGQYDGVNMVLSAIANGATTADAVRSALATGSHRGLAMTYRSDGRGNMAHAAVIVCYDGESRIPAIVRRYDSLGLP